MKNSKKMKSKKMGSKKIKSIKRKVLAKGKSNNSINLKTVKSINYKTMFPFNCKHCQMRYKTKFALQLHKQILNHQGKLKKKKINSNNVFDKRFHN